VGRVQEREDIKMPGTFARFRCLVLVVAISDVCGLSSINVPSKQQGAAAKTTTTTSRGGTFFGGPGRSSLGGGDPPIPAPAGIVAFAAGLGSLVLAQRAAPMVRRGCVPPPPPPAGRGGGGGCGGGGGGTGGSGGKSKKVADPWSGNWWKKLPGGPFNPVYWWWRIKVKGPYTRLYINHVNPLCKIVAFSSKKMLTLQVLAMIGQVGQILDKSWRPQMTEEHWWSVRYYSFFAVIHAIRIHSILQEQKPILLSAEEMEIFASVFQANQFTPRQFISLRKIARKKKARAHALIKPRGVAMHSLILVIR
jgi:hypothetical protein